MSTGIEDDQLLTATMNAPKHDDSNPHVISTWDTAIEAYRSKFLRQGLYDGGVIMEDVLINLHGLEHRDRRRLENPLFRRNVLFAYEREMFPAVLQARLRPHLADGHLELLSFGHGVMLELAAVNAGLDLDIGDVAATKRLGELLLLFIDGARILHYTGDKAAKEREVALAIDQLRDEFVQPALERRKSLLDAGEIAEEKIPRDILRVLVENVEGLDLDPDTIVRETAFFLLTGASTSAAALAMTLNNVFEWIAVHPEDELRLTEEPAFVQRCIFETLRLAPISPIAARWATEDFVMSDGTEIVAGERLHIDMVAANRTQSIFGEDANEFDPERKLPENVPLYGVSFGHGMHHCIGQELAVGVDPDPSDGFESRLFGLVGVVIQELIKLGVRPDPDNPAEIDALSERGNFKSYPVLLTAIQTVGSD